MKGRSREAKGHKSTGGGRTWYGKRETLTPCPPPPHKNVRKVKNFLVRCKGCSLVGCVLLRGCVNTAQILHVFLQPG